MSIVIRNETEDEITLEYDNAEITIDPNKFIEVENLDKVNLGLVAVKIRKGVIKIKQLL